MCKTLMIMTKDSYAGTGQCTKTDEFSEKFQTAFDPPHFAIFFGKRPSVCFAAPTRPLVRLQFHVFI